jgi:aryl-alcohol dehydrogenase-like predicted oxidoreductase
MINTPASKLCLGTAQFGLDYGIANRGKIPEADIGALLKYAHAAGVTMLDTASAYGVSEEVIGRALNLTEKTFEIVSKLPGEAGAERGIVGQSLKRLGVKKIYGYLIHAFEEYKNNPGVWDTLKELQTDGVIGKIGFSLYHPQDLEWLLVKDVRFDLVQIPYSIFDRRFQQYLSVLKSRKVEIHVRSVFLQGLAFLKPDELPAILRPASVQLKTLGRLAGEHGIGISALCLNFVFLNDLIDRIVIGIDGLSHLKENLTDLECMAQVKELAEELNQLAIEDEDILLPYRWKL